jgi:hypothetical protein
MIGTSQGVIMSILVIYIMFWNLIASIWLETLLGDVEFLCTKTTFCFQNTYSIPLHDKNIIVASLLTLFFLFI